MKAEKIKSATRPVRIGFHAPWMQWGRRQSLASRVRRALKSFKEADVEPLQDVGSGGSAVYGELVQGLSARKHGARKMDRVIQVNGEDVRGLKALVLEENWRAWRAPALWFVLSMPWKVQPTVEPGQR